MRRLALTFIALAAGLSARAAGTPVERIYVSTDRTVYIAGDAVWCSLTCLDENGRLSNASAVSYVELVSDEGTACTAKIGLLEGLAKRLADERDDCSRDVGSAVDDACGEGL